MSGDSEKRLRELLASDGRAQVVVVSGSMDPFLPIGATAEAVPCKFEDLTRFDIVLFRHIDRVICHGVWGPASLKNARGEPTLITWGLANPAADDPVAAVDIIGRISSPQLSAAQVAWVSALRLVSRIVSGRLFYILLLLLTIWFRFFGDENVLFAICSAVGVYVFAQLQVGESAVRGRLMALALAASPFSAELAHSAKPWATIEALTVCYIVAIWNFIEGEQSRLLNTVLVTVGFAAYLKFVPHHLAFAIPLPNLWQREDWFVPLNPITIFAGVTVAAWLYRFLFSLTVKRA